MLPDFVDRLGEGFDLKRLLQRRIVAEIFGQTRKAVSRGEYNGEVARLDHPGDWRNLCAVEIHVENREFEFGRCRVNLSLPSTAKQPKSPTGRGRRTASGSDAKLGYLGLRDVFFRKIRKACGRYRPESPNQNFAQTALPS